MKHRTGVVEEMLKWNGRVHVDVSTEVYTNTMKMKDKERGVGERRKDKV